MAFSHFSLAKKSTPAFCLNTCLKNSKTLGFYTAFACVRMNECFVVVSFLFISFSTALPPHLHWPLGGVITIKSGKMKWKLFFLAWLKI